MKTRTTFYLYKWREKPVQIDVSPTLKGFEKGQGLDARIRTDLCSADFERVTGLKLPSRKLFKATLIIKQIGQRGIREHA